MGELLSLVLFPILGISVLLLREQLRDRRLWRCDVPLELADFGPLNLKIGGYERHERTN